MWCGVCVRVYVHVRVFMFCFVLQDISVLEDLETIKQLGHILKTNVRACTAVGHPFVVQVQKLMYMYMCSTYNICMYKQIMVC